MTSSFNTDSLCYTCLKPIIAAHNTCPHCNSRNIISHPELFNLSIAHIDCDAFYASIEKRDNPSLLSKPVIVGGLSNRGVVATCCYVARKSGVRSAMPMYKAQELCPDAVVIKPNMQKYKKASLHIRKLMQALTPLVEPLSIDEAFLDMSGTTRMHHAPPALMLAKLAKTIEKDVGITVSVGLAPNKFLAKLASNMQKPSGFTIIGEQEKLTRLATLPVTALWGVGKSMTAKLAKDGISHISQLQTMDERTLAKRYGEIGLRLYRLARGIDIRKVEPNSLPKSISSEQTFDKDIWQSDHLIQKLWTLSEEVSGGLKKKGYAASTITVKLKTQNHKIITRSHTLESPTQLTDILFEHGEALLKPLCNGTYYRLLGIGASNLSKSLYAADPLDLIEPKRNRRAQTERVMDQLRERFGKESIRKGRALPTKANTKPQ